MHSITLPKKASYKLLDSLSAEELRKLGDQNRQLELDLIKLAGETPLGTGDRVRRLAKINPHSAQILEKQRARQCERELQKDGKYKGKRFLQVPPFPLKGPIWKPRPRRHPAEPNTLQKLKRRSLTYLDHPGFAERIRVGNLPRYEFEALYRHGELGEQERIFYLALCDYAREKELGKNEKCLVAVNEIAEWLNRPCDDLFRRSLSRSLYRLAGTALILREGDPLYDYWMTESWFLFPHMSIQEAWRKKQVAYSLASDIIGSMEEKKLTTVDMLALHTLPSPTAKSLHILIYDIAQWYTAANEFTFKLPDLVKLTALKVSNNVAKDKNYQHWAQNRRILEQSMGSVAKYGGFLHDWAMEGQGEDTTCTVWFPAQRLHLSQHIN